MWALEFSWDNAVHQELMLWECNITKDLWNILHNSWEWSVYERDLSHIPQHEIDLYIASFPRVDQWIVRQEAERIIWERQDELIELLHNKVGVDTQSLDMEEWDKDTALQILGLFSVLLGISVQEKVRGFLDILKGPRDIMDHVMNDGERPQKDQWNDYRWMSLRQWLSKTFDP